MLKLRKLFRSWLRPRFNSEIKIPWYRRLWTQIKTGCYKAYTAVFGFHTPAWVTHVQSALQPPAKEIKPVQYLNPFYWVIWATRFVWGWLNSRPYSSIGAAVPAIIVACIAVVLVVELRFRNLSEKQATYRLIVTEAAQRKDYDTALVALSTLTDMDPRDMSIRYNRALIEFERGNKEEAKQQMIRLATAREYGDAALWILRQELDLKNMGEWTREQHDQFRLWSDIALKTPSSKMPAHMLLASYSYGIGAFSESLRHFKEITDQFPEYALTAAKIQKQIGDLDKAKETASRAAKFYEEKLKQSPNNRDHRINLARALVLMEREQDASRLLLEGFDFSQRQDQELRTAAGEALVAYFMRLSELPNASDFLMQRMQLVKAAMDIAPDSPMVVDAIIELLLRCRDNKNAEVNTLMQALVQGVSPEATHFIRGTLALLNNDFGTAKTHLEQAAKYSENLPGILNNLALAMSKMENSDLDAALALSNAALEKMPDQPYLRDTRGQILVKLKRFQDAIPDLEFALKAPELGGVVHDSLAVSYEAIGQQDLAEKHRALAESLKSKPSPNTPKPKSIP